MHLLSDRTSFRNEGIDGEFDLICRSLGLSSPEDFAIPVAACSFSGIDYLRSSRVSNATAGLIQSGLSEIFESKVRVTDGEIKRCTESSISVRDGVKTRGDVNEINRVSNSNNGGILGNVENDGVLDNDSDGDTWRGIKVDDRIFVKEGKPSSRIILRNDAIFSSSGSDASDDDDVSSCEAIELEYSVSSNGSLCISQNWQKGDLLGLGSLGFVYEGFTDHGFFFAVKEVSLLNQGSQTKQSIVQLEHDISLLSQFQHENIVRYLGTNTDDGRLYIFLELVTGGSLANLYRKYHLRDSQVSTYTRQILSGLNFLHEQNVVHGDIKCANILVDVNGSLKLADFGLAKATILNDIKSCKGTLPYWMAPEVVNNRKDKEYGLAADIWSLGCTMLEMLTRRIPYSHLEGMQALFRIGRGELPPIPTTLSREARDFILNCLQVDPNDRPTAAQLLRHPFVMRSDRSFFMFFKYSP